MVDTLVAHLSGLATVLHVSSVDRSTVSVFSAIVSRCIGGIGKIVIRRIDPCESHAGEAEYQCPEQYA